MTHEQVGLQPLSPARRRWTRAVGWILIAAGVILSWTWSVELTIPGESVNASLAGAGTFLLFCAGLVMLWRPSPHRDRRWRVGYRIAIGATAVLAIVAGVVPVAIVAATTGTATAEVTTGTSGTGYTVSDVAMVASDKYHRTNLTLTVRATDRTTPLLEATVSFGNGTRDVTCANTRQTWTHDISTVELACDDFVPSASLTSISGVAVEAR